MDQSYHDDRGQCLESNVVVGMVAVNEVLYGCLITDGVDGR